MSRPTEPWVAYMLAGSSWCTLYNKGAQSHPREGIYPRFSHTNMGLRLARRVL